MSPDTGVSREVDVDDVEDLLLELSGEAFTGSMQTAASDIGEATLYFDEGFVSAVVVEGESPGEELRRMLEAAERLPRDELERAVDHAAEEGGSLRDSLYDLDILDVGDVRRAVKGRLTFLLNRFCDANPDTARIREARAGLNEVTDVPALRAHVPLEGIVFKRRIERFKQLSVDERRGLVETHRKARPVVGAGGEGRIERASAADDRAKLAHDLLDGSRCLPDVVAESFLPPADTVGVVFGLRSMEMVEFKTSYSPVERARRLTDEIEVKHLSVHKASYFEVLNIHWSSYDQVVDEAYARESEHFDPDRAPDTLGDEPMAKLREIAQRIDRAHEALASRDGRDEYRQKIVPEYKIDHTVEQLEKRAELARERGLDEIAEESRRRIEELRPDFGAVPAPDEPE